jgi:hypothetical protein
MANQGKQGGPSHEAQVKGGQHSHQGSESSSSGSKSGTQNQPSRESSSKGGQQSGSGSGKK